MADWDKLAKEHPRYERLALKYHEPRPRRLLSLDGGGIRGVITLQVLAELEEQLKAKAGGGDDFRLGDYFDYIGGTSTGAIIASCLAYGFTVKKIAELYDSLGKEMFKKPWNPVKWLWYKYQSEPLVGQLKDIFGKDEDGDDFKLGSGQLRCLLLLVLRNVSTDSPWPISSNPYARYNIGEGADYGAKKSNLFVPLYQLVRASTAAPTFFSPQEIEVSSKNSVKKFKFEDGGVTPYNNPAFLLYRMATVPSYNLAWEEGEDKLLLVSIGTGAAPRLQDNFGANFLLSNAALVPNALMYGALVDQDINCRMAGRCVHGARIDSELGDLIPPATSEAEGPKFTPRPGHERAFVYARYNAELSTDWFKKNGFEGLDPDVVGKLDSTDHIEDLRRIGQKSPGKLTSASLPRSSERSEAVSQKTYERMRAFIVTPFGAKKDGEGNLIDFDAVRLKLIEPALDQLGLAGRTTGEIVRAGNIHADMFQLLLTADLVVAEVSIHNANVFYELGIRHALRPYRTFMLRGKGDKHPFDLETYRYMTYEREDPAASLGKMVDNLRATLDSNEQDSPVFRSLPALREQERSHFLPVPVEFREEVEQGQADKRRGDLALLAMETRGFEWGVEGLRVVGRAQFKLKDFEGARASWEEVRDPYPEDKEANTWLGTIYQRLGKLKLSDQRVNRVLDNLETTPKERAEAYTLQGRNAKTRWVEDWKGDTENPHPVGEWPERALRSPFLKEAYELCEKGFGEDLNHFYSGLNALAMLTVMIELASGMEEIWAESYDDPDEAPAALTKLKKQRDALVPSVARSINAAMVRLKREVDAAKNPAQRDEKLDELRWATISEADHYCLTSKQPNVVKSRYRTSLTGVADFYGESASQQLILYRELGVLKDNVAAGLEIAKPPEEKPAEVQPQVFVFTGHRIDDADRAAKGKSPRFPQASGGAAREGIKAAILAELGEGNTNAVGIAGGASGGDILFHEVCAELKIPTRLYLALPRADYVAESVQGAGPDWVRRFNKLYETLERREMAASKDMPRWLRERGDKYNVWQRSNLWILNNAFALDKKGGINLTLIALWNGKQGDGAGGTEDMVEQAKKRAAKTIILPTEKLFGLAGEAPAKADE